jgi:signal transduction histidine kinase
MKEVTKILLVDDDEEDYMITRDIIGDITSRKYKLEWTPSFDDALKKINEGDHDVYLIDYRLGVKTGLELIQAAVQNGCSSPLILLTGQGAMEIDEKALEAGASDYLVKGTLNPHQLERAIRYGIEHANNLKEIKKLNSELEARVEERTKELNEAIKKLEVIIHKERELNELKSRFVTMASHEFRTPLSTILSSASLISKYNNPDDEDKRAKHIQRIKSSVNNLTGILNDFLSLSKLEEGKVHFNPVMFDFNELAEETLEEMEALVKAGQKIDYQKDRNENLIHLDKQAVKNILINLLSNAIKYSGENKTILFKTEVSNSILTIKVKDEGIGISETDKEYLFSRFFRGQNVTNIQGTGLGLNIVKRYVDLMNGSITCDSELNKGTTFTILIPLN